MKDICKKGKNKKKQTNKKIPSQHRKPNPNVCEAKVLPVAPGGLGGSEQGPPSFSPKSPRVHAATGHHWGQRAMPELGYTMAWADASLSRVGPTPGCLQAPQTFGWAARPPPQTPQITGNPRAGANPSPAALPGGGCEAAGTGSEGPSKPPGNEGTLFQGTRGSAEPEMGAGDAGLSGTSDTTPPHRARLTPLVSAAGVRFPGVGVLPGVPTGAGVKPKVPGRSPRCPGGHWGGGQVQGWLQLCPHPHPAGAGSSPAFGVAAP